MKNKLIGSAQSVNDLRDLIEKNWGWHNVTFDLITNQVFVSNKPIDDLKIIKKGNRWQLRIIT